MARNGDYHILSLDGGGTWSLIQAKTLLKLYPENPPGHELLSRFDLVAATSGGAIVAGCLMSNMRPSDMVEMYTLQWLARIFAELPLYRQLPRIVGLGPRFSTEEKLEGLKALFGKYAGLDLDAIRTEIRKSVGKEAPDFLITSFNYDRHRIALFRSNRSSPAASRAKILASNSLVDAVHASTTAPVNYFDLPADVSGRRFWDGGISGANNPVMVAVVEALASRVRRESIRVLSIGTGSVFRPLTGGLPPLVQELETPSLLHDIREVASSILDDPPDTATFMAHVVLGGKMPVDGEPVTHTSVIRMSPLVQPVWRNEVWTAPDGLTLEEFASLVDMDIAVVDADKVALLEKFCGAWMDERAPKPVPNQPIRINGDTLACEIGHSTFSLARQAWQALQ